MRGVAAVIVWLGLIVLALPVAAQIPATCAVPPATLTFESSKCERTFTAKEGQRKPDSYLLAVSWSPGFCGRVSPEKPQFNWQCQKNSFAWVVHGLWPQYNTGGWPEYCQDTAGVPAALVREQLCFIPGDQLVQCAWAKHGTCTPFTQDEYFIKTRAVFNSINFPSALSEQLEKDGKIKRQELLEALQKANPTVPANSIALSCRDRRFFQEVRFCLNTDLKPQQCQNVRKSCTAPTLFVGKPTVKKDESHAKTY